MRNFRFMQCASCGFVYRESQDDSFLSYSTGSRERHEFERFYLKARRASYCKILDWLEPARQLNRFLDVGAGYGDFLLEAQQQRWEVTGVEPQLYQSVYAIETLDLNVYNGTLNTVSLPEQIFDVITLWDVIEHVEKPLDLIQQCHQLLRHGGYLFIKTPDARGLIPPATLWRKPILWAYRHLVFPTNPTQHLCFFDPEHLEEALKSKGFRVVRYTDRELWEERIVSGRNSLVRWIRWPLMWSAWRLDLPFEISFLAEKT